MRQERATLGDAAESRGAAPASSTSRGQKTGRSLWNRHLAAQSRRAEPPGGAENRSPLHRCVCVCVCVCVGSFYQQSEDIGAAPRNFKGLLEASGLDLRSGLGLG